MIEGKRGDVATTLLVVISFVSVVVLLAIFFYYKEPRQELPVRISEMMAEVEFSEQYILSEARVIGEKAILNGGDLKTEFIKIVGERKVDAKNFGNFFVKIKNGEFTFEEDGGILALKMDRVALRSKKGYNEIYREFSIVIYFDCDMNKNCRDVSGFN